MEMSEGRLRSQNSTLNLGPPQLRRGYLNSREGCRFLSFWPLLTLDFEGLEISILEVFEINLGSISEPYWCCFAVFLQSSNWYLQGWWGHARSKGFQSDR